MGSVGSWCEVQALSGISVRLSHTTHMTRLTLRYPLAGTEIAMTGVCVCASVCMHVSLRAYMCMHVCVCLCAPTLNNSPSLHDSLSLSLSFLLTDICVELRR